MILTFNKYNWLYYKYAQSLRFKSTSTTEHRVNVAFRLHLFEHKNQSDILADDDSI